MVRFIQYWIEQSMEDRSAREETTRQHLEKVAAGAEKLRERWALPAKPAGYWNGPAATAPTRQAVASAEAQILSPYERMLRDMEDSKRESAGK